jgi:hypothetical protein
MKNLAWSIPPLRELLDERDALRAELRAMRAAPAQAPSAPTPADPASAEFVPAGHFYSAIPSREEVRQRAAQLFGARPRTLPGVDLRESAQLELLRAMKKDYDEQPFSEKHTPPRRYFFENPSYSYSDAIFLYLMIRHVQPKRILEVGSGYSSCVSLDTSELFFQNAIKFTFVEPYPDLLRSLLRAGDADRIRICPTQVQAVDLDLFKELEANDILFIDSTHVSKVGSDVNFIFFEVLPRLAPGVYVHFHDVFYPFEYPSAWIYEGRAWTEDYLLRAFLTHNSEYEVVLFNSFLEYFHRQYFVDNMPLCLRDLGGSIWLHRKPSANNE